MAGLSSASISTATISIDFPSTHHGRAMSSNDTETVRMVTMDEYKEVARCLAEAFEKDDVARYAIDTPDQAHLSSQEKWELHLETMEYLVCAHILKGMVTTVGADYASVAMWMPPGYHWPWWVYFRSGMWRLSFKFGVEAKKRFFKEFLPLLHGAKAEVLGDRDDESWYLVYLGTKSSAKGKGYARKLIEHVTDQADAENRATYLESSNDINPKIYQKFGFEIRKQIYLNRGPKPIRMDIMVREAVRPTINGSSALQGGVASLENASRAIA